MDNFPSSTKRRRKESYRDVLNQILVNESKHSLTDFRVEYERLYKNFRKSGENIKRLVGKTKRIDFEKRHAVGITQKLEKYVEEKKNIYEVFHKQYKLEKESLDYNTRVVNDSHERVNKIKKKLEEQKEKLEESYGYERRCEKVMNDLQKTRSKLGKQRDLCKTRIFDIEQKIITLQEKIDELQEQKVMCKKQVKNVAEELTRMVQIIEDNSHGIEDNQKLSEFLKVNISKELANIEMIKAKLGNMKNGNIGIAESSTEKTEDMKESIIEIILAKDKLEGIKKSLRMIIGENSILEVRKNNIRVELNFYDDKGADMERTLEMHRVKLAKIEESIKEVDMKIAGKGRIRQNLMRQLRAKVIENKKIEAGTVKLKRVSERDRNNQNVVTHKNNMIDVERHKQEDVIIIKKGERRNISLEMDNYKRSLQTNFEKIVKIQDSHVKISADLSSINHKILVAREKNNFHKMQNQKLIDAIDNEKKKGEELKNLIIAVKKDRENLTKTYHAILRNITNINKRFKFFTHKIAHLRKDITLIDQKITKENGEIGEGKLGVKKSKEALERLDRILKERKKNNLMVKKKLFEIEKIIRSAELEKRRQVQEVSSVNTDREVMKKKLIERNMDISDLYEKIKVQQSLMNKNKNLYRQSVEEKTILMLKIRECEKKLKVLETVLEDNEKLPEQVKSLRKEFLKEKYKENCFANMGIRMNVHHYRELKGDNPEIYAQIKKKKKIQDELIEVSTILTKREMMIKEKENLFEQLRVAMRKQPKIEDTEILKMYKQNFQKKRAQKKKIEKELKEIKLEYNEKMLLNEKLKADLQKVKKKFYKPMYFDRPRTGKSRKSVGKRPTTSHM